MRGKLAFLAVWTPLMALSVWWLFFQNTSGTQSGTPLARISEQVGDIQYRPDDDILWHTAENNQYVFENDNIATGPNSYASINFGNSRTIELGPQTQIRIRPVGKDGDEFELDLLRGQVAARPGSESDQNVKGARKGMRIYTGSESFSLKRQAELVLKRDRGQEMGDVLFALGQISRNGADGSKNSIKVDGENISLSSQVNEGLEIIAKTETPPPPPPVKKDPPKRIVRITPIPPPPPIAPPPAPVPAKPVEDPKVALAAPSEKGIDYLPVLAFPPPGSIVWGSMSWKEMITKPLQLVIEPPNKKPDAIWQPIVASSTKERPDERVFILQGKDEFRRQVLGLKLDKMRDRGFLRQESSAEEYQIELAAGVRLKHEGTANEAATAPRMIRIRSAQTMPASKSGIKVRLARLIMQTKSVPWFVTPDKFTESSFVYLKDSGDFLNIQGLLPSSQGFTVEASGNEIQGRGIFIVRDHTLVGKIGGQTGSQKSMDGLRTALRAEAIYRGSATAYIGGLTHFKERAVAKKLPEKIYILHDGRFIGVSRDFMKTNPTLRKFLEQKTSAFFTEPIEILSAENFVHEGVAH